MKTSALTTLALAFATTTLAALPVAAQDLERGETVLTRPRPEVEALGVRAGSFLILPLLEAGVTYDSNVFATKDNKEDDFIRVINPELRVRSDFSRHALNFTARGTLGRYKRFESENYSDYLVQLDGRVDVLRDINVDARFFHAQEHEGRGDPDTEAGLAEPQIYTRSGGLIGYNHTFNRIRTRLSAGAEYFAYDSVRRLDGTTSRQNDRDRWEMTTALRVGYEVMPGYEGFVQGSLSRIVYQVSPNYAGINRDSNGYEIVGGLATDLTGVLSGEIFAGYLSRSYEDSRLKDFGGLGFGGRLNWAVTQLTTVTGSLRREVRETTTASAGGVASSYARTLFAVGVDHELLRTLLLNGRAQYYQDAYEGIERTDEVYTFGVGATYLINRNVYLTGGYTYEARQSDTNAQDYDSNLIFLRLGLQL